MVQGIVTRCPLRLDLRHGDTEHVQIKYKQPGCDARDESSWVLEEVEHEDVGDAVQRATEVRGHTSVGCSHRQGGGAWAETRLPA